MKLNKDRKRGIIGTILVHSIIFLLLILMALRTPLPLPGEEGVEINLGYDENGLGDIQTEPPANQVAPNPKNYPPPEPEKNIESVEEDIVTQDVEEAPSIDKEVYDQEIQENEDEFIEEKLEDYTPEEVIDSSYIHEENIEEVVLEEQKPVVNTRALYTGSTAESQGNSQGVTQGSGDQGKPYGDKDSQVYDGKGGAGNGISFFLGGRGSLLLEKPTAKFNEQGSVVVNIWVDRSGIVKKAQVSAKGTTIVEPRLKKIAIDAAYNSKFAQDKNASELQRGTITYNFIVR
ncbi:MAG: hypothetical protein CMF58_05890 [Lentimicrobiaceae bacterium]|jgi:colicin import membrane protein|nr:hypothetical protein [Lentimicrobiaceae bacterium]MDG1901903.1 hypothetical protein [Bacteroidales bacterium]MDG2081048.1 hypothetical protein [Bacteroidales bacterium]